MSRARRRQFLIATTALLAAPLAAEAQRATSPRIGVMTFNATTEAFREAFRAGLREHSYIEGQNILVEWRSAQGQTDRANAIALDFVRMKVDVIVATPTQAVQAAKHATNSIPIVMAPAGDPVATGFVASLARPGGNVTGVSNNIADLGGKLLQLIREVQPATNRVAVLVGATNPLARPIVEQAQAAGSQVGIHIQPVMLTVGAEDFESAFVTMTKEKAGAVLVQPIYATQRVADLAAKHRLPSISTGIATRTFPNLGGLLTYGAVATDDYRHAAVYVDKILRGANPADLPVEQPTKFELVINSKTARILGLTIPQSLLGRADEVIH